MLSSSVVQDARSPVSAGALLDRYAAYILIAPTLAGVLIVDVYPLIFNTLISLHARKISTASAERGHELIAGHPPFSRNSILDNVALRIESQSTRTPRPAASAA